MAGFDTLKRRGARAKAKATTSDNTPRGGMHAIAVPEATHTRHARAYMRARPPRVHARKARHGMHVRHAMRKRAPRQSG